MPASHAIRVVCAARRLTGTATFNQVVLDNDPSPPPGVLLVAICPGEGLRLWMTSLSEVAPLTRPQAKNYSHGLNMSVDNPPPILGQPVRIPIADVEAIRAGLFQEIIEARTNTKHKLVRELFEF